MISGCLVRSAHIQSGAGDATNGVVSLSPRSTLVHLRPFCTVQTAGIVYLEAKSLSQDLRLPVWSDAFRRSETAEAVTPNGFSDRL